MLYSRVVSSVPVGWFVLCFVRGGLPGHYYCYSARLCPRHGFVLFCFGVVLHVFPLCLLCFRSCVLPFARLCSASPPRALEVFVKLVAAATPPHPFTIVGQSCFGRFRAWSSFGCHCGFFIVVELAGFAQRHRSGLTLLPLLFRIDLYCLLYRAVAHFPWVSVPVIRGFSVSGSRLPGLPDLSRALFVCVPKPRRPVLRSPFGDGSRVGTHFPLALPVGGGVWISSADAEASTDVI